MHLTKRSRGILNAWHFQFDSVLVYTAQWFKFGGCVAHPLTRRYVLKKRKEKDLSSTGYNWDVILELVTMPYIWGNFSVALLFVLYTGRKSYIRIKQGNFSTKHWVLVGVSCFVVLFFCSVLEQVVSNYGNGNVDISIVLVLSIYTTFKKFLEITALGGLLAIASNSLKERASNCSRQCNYVSNQVSFGACALLCSACVVVTFLLTAILFK